MRKHIPIQFIMRINFDRFRVILSSISFSIDSFNQRMSTVQRFSFFSLPTSLYVGTIHTISAVFVNFS